MKTAYFNARVYAGDGAFASAFVVEDGRFVAVGDDAEMLALLSGNDARVDCRGRFVCAGFNDSHMHLLGYGGMLGAAQLAPHTGSLAGLLEYVRSFLAENPPREGEWLRGRGWNQDLFSDARRMPDRHDLDAVSTQTPILLTRACGHCCVVNSRALALAGIGPGTAAPEGGAIGFENGEPDGRLYDNAMELVYRTLPAPDKAAVKAMLRRAAAAANRYGVTSVQTDDYQTFPGVTWETVNAAYRELKEAGELSVRVCEQANFADLGELSRFISAGNTTGAGDERFRIGPVKLLGDGSLGSRTAYLSRPYADDPDTRGLLLFSVERLNAMVEHAHAHGMQLAVHAIGDACLDAVLDAFERALAAHPRADHRHGVVHCQITRPEQLERIRALGLHVYAQTIFLDYDNRIVEKRVGPELAATSYSWKALMDGGVSVSNGSDCPVELPDVMAGVQCAVTRASLDGTGPYLPEQAFSVLEALDSYTCRGAEASFEEALKGRVAPGQLADFVMLSEDPFDAPPARLRGIAVEGCWLGGERVFGDSE